MARKVQHSDKRLTAGQLKELKELAQGIDTEEQAQIKSRGRAVLARHRRLRAVVHALKAERERLEMSLADVGERSGIGKSNLSRLENNPAANPTIDTLQRYAESLGKQIVVDVVDGAPPKTKAG